MGIKEGQVTALLSGPSAMPTVNAENKTLEGDHVPDSTAVAEQPQGGDRHDARCLYPQRRRPRKIG